MSIRERFLNRHVLLELGPVAAFFIANWFWGLAAATAAVMVATACAVTTGLVLNGRVPLIAVASLLIVLLLGGASLVFDDETFIKIRPTVGNCLFAAALLAGFFFREGFLQRALGTQLSLSARGWHTLTLCWISIALTFAGLNEIVWRSLSTDQWVAYKTAATPAAIVIYILVTNYIARRHWHETPAADANADQV